LYSDKINIYYCNYFRFFKDAKYLSKKADIYYYWPILKFMKIIGKINDYKIIMI